MPKNNLLKYFASKISYVFIANIISLLINVLILLIIPKFIGVEAFGYFQLYQFYISYAGMLYFGWCEGIYLRIGGKYYSELNKNIYAYQFWLLALFEIFICTGIFCITSFFVNDVEKHNVIGYSCFAIVPICLRYFITTILQGTSRTNEYAIITVSEKIIFFFLSIILIFTNHFNYKLMICSNILAICISLSEGIIFCKDVVFAKFKKSNEIFKEIKINISAGIKLMLSTLCSLFIIGVVRFGIENHWDIATFGKVSLTLSISNMVVTAINAVGVVIYPILRRTNQNKLSDIYKIMRIMLMGLVFGAIIFYYPAQKILTLWLPQYAESLRYAAILLPICVYESKVSILINTYFNTLRLESLQMKCNMATLALSVVCTLISTILLNSVTAAIISILVVLIFRCILSEVILSTKISINVTKDIFIELAMTVAFVICNWYLGFWGMIIYAFCYVIYLFIKKQDILGAWNFVKSMR